MRDEPAPAQLQSAPLAPAPTASLTRPIVIGHRGASGLRPEHTLASYALAIEHGADFVEPDLVSTRDGVLVARHENEVGSTTNVADHPEFAARRTTKMIDGRLVEGWFTEDFTLAELKTLRARERIPELRPGNVAWNDRFEIPTLDEVLALVRAKEKETGRVIGLYPETKHPSYFARIGLPLEDRLLATLASHGYAGRDAAVFIQSFEVANLRALATRTELPLAQLIDEAGAPADFAASGDPRGYADLVTPDGLRWIAGYADAVGVPKSLIVPRRSDGTAAVPTTLVADAHAAGLKVHVWTFRNENAFLPAEFRRGAAPGGEGDWAAEYRLFFSLAIDGAFSDYPGSAVAVRADPQTGAPRSSATP